MIKHLVIFKYKEGITGGDARVKTAITALGALTGTIPVIKSFSLGLNLSDRPIAYDYGLVVDFDNLEDLQTYLVHPDHVAVMQLLKEAFIWNICDFEV